MQHDLSKPAFEGLGGQNAQWVRQPPEIETKLSEALSINGSCSKLDTPQDGLLGHYRVTTPDGLVFAKVLQPQKAERQIAADSLIREIASERFLLSMSLDRSPRPIDNDLCIMTYNYIPGASLPHTAQALWKLGEALGCLHLELGELRCSAEIHRRCTSRWDVLMRHKNALERNIYDKVGDISARQSIVDSLDQNVTDHLSTSPQVIHGDLNYGNVLLDLKPGGKIAFLDFEEATESFYSPLFDVAMVIERFILTASTDKEALLHAFCEAYRAAGGGWFSNDVQLSDMLKGLAIRALLVLTASREAGWPDWKEQEWRKFVGLHQSAVDSDETLKRWSKCQF